MAVLYVGTSEALAKSSPRTGLKATVILSDVYPGIFACLATTGQEPWGIVEVDFDFLAKNHLAPFHGYLERKSRRLGRQEYLKNIFRYKSQWRQSLQSCGVCLYLDHIPPAAISRISIYKGFGDSANEFVSSATMSIDPWDLTLSKHKSNYKFNLCLTRWLACEALAPREFSKNTHPKLEAQLENRAGLELFYRRSEKAEWWK